MENGLSSRMAFQDEAVRFSRAGGDHTVGRKPPAAGFPMDGGDKAFSGGHREGRFVRAQYGSHIPNWNPDLDGGSPSADGSDGYEQDEEDEDDDVEEDDFEGNNMKNNSNGNGSVNSSSQKIHSEKGNNRQEHHSSFGSSRGMVMKDGSLREQQNQHDRVRAGYENAITVVDPELYCAQILHGGDMSANVQKEMGGENGYGFGGRKEIALSIYSGDSLRTHLLDPITGALMDDAMILSCGHSYGSGGLQHVFRMKACCKCSQPISEDLVRPNLALRSAVQAFRREEESQSLKTSKRRRDRFEQDKCNYDDPYPMDSRGKGVQFPFAVSDRVIIKGNKRTPQRFVGRVAVVTTQCLNGWYVVKTLDNAESVKLQYRSLAKFTEDSPPNVIQNKSLSPNWL